MPRGHVPWLLAALILGSACRRKPALPLPVADVGRGAGGTTVAAVPETSGSRPVLTLLYSGNWGGRILPDPNVATQPGLAQRATAVDRIRLQVGTLLQLDAGDLLAGRDDATAANPSPRAYPPGRRSSIVLTSYARMGVDVITLGERDLDIGLPRLQNALREAELTVVAANLVANTANVLVFPADTMLDAGPRRVGVFGILEVSDEDAAGLLRSGVHTTDAIEAARASSGTLRTRGADLVVGLFHLNRGMARAKEILKRVADIDIVILGHDDGGPVPATPITVGHSRVFTPPPHGTGLGRLDVDAWTGPQDIQLTDHVVTLETPLPEQLSVALVERVEIERPRLRAEEAAAAFRRKKKQKDPQPPTEIWSFGSNGACGLCHQDAVAQWQTTDHAHALATLEKVNHGRDPACLGCHVTAYLQPGGTRNLTTVTKFFADVGCESCHGPSAAHVRSIDKRVGTSRTVKAEVCLGCHTPDQNIGPFDFAVGLKAILGPGHGQPAATVPPG